MIKHLLYIISFMLVAFKLEATNVLIEVKDVNDKKAISNVRVDFLSDQNVPTSFVTDSTGIVLLKNVSLPLKVNFSNEVYLPFISVVKFSNLQFKNDVGTIQIFLTPSTKQITEFVVTGQAVPVMAKQSIYKVNTIGSTEINQRAAVTLNDVLTYEMNSFISNDNLLGSSVNIGGIGGQNVKILLNGIPMMGRENGNIDMGQINMNNIKRIETIQGPMSVMYGSNALGGVINLITATPKKQFSLNARSYTESIGRYNFSSSLGLNKKRHQFQFSIARNFFGGWTPKDSIDRFQLWKPKTQYTGDLQYWFTTKYIKWNYFASYLNEKISNKGEPIINPYEGYAFDEYYRTNRMINAVSAAVTLSSKEQLNFSNSYQIYYRTKNRIKKDLVNLREFETKNVGDQDTTTFRNINIRGTFSSKRIKHVDFLAGYEYAYETGVSYKLKDDVQTMSELGVFSSLAYTFKSFQIQPSFRVTYNNRFNTGYTPALHAKLDVDKNTQLRGSYARGFRAPTLKELYLQFIDQNHTILGNPELQPEVGDHVELGLDHQKSIKNTTLGFSINAYHNSIQNLIALAVFSNHGILRQYENIEQYKNWIANVKGKLTTTNLTAQLGSGFIFVEKTNSVPEHTIFELSGSTNYFIKKINTAFNFNYKFNSRQPVVTTDQQFLFTSPLHIANASFQRSFFKKALQAQIGIRNLFNIQNASLTGSINTQNSGHNSSNAMQIFPKRSFFIDLSYSL